MDLNDLDAELGNLRSLPAPSRPPIEILAARMRRRHRRRALGATLAGVTAIVVAGIGFLAVARDDGVTVLSNGPHASTVDPDAPSGTVVVPDLVGRTLSVGSGMADSVGLSLTVSEGDAAVADAVIVATEPGPGVTVPAGSVIGARSALPDPPVDVECPNGRHPRGKANADALPSADGLGRSEAEAEVLALRALTPESSDTEVYLGIWDRWAYTDDAGLNVIPTKGFQVIIVTQDPARCPSAPSFRNVPVTVVLGDLTSWAGELIAPTRPVSVTAIEVSSDADSGQQIDLVLDGPVPDRQVTYVDGIATQPESVAYTTQQDPTSVHVCDAVHSFPAPSIGTIDVFIPSGWLDRTKAIKQIAPTYPTTEEHPGKIVACGPYDGFVQFSIWDPTSTDPARLDVHLSEDGTRIVVKVHPAR